MDTFSNKKQFNTLSNIWSFSILKILNKHILEKGIGCECYKEYNNFQSDS